MLYDYARLAQDNASAVPAFAEAVRRWPTLENGKRDTLAQALADDRSERRGDAASDPDRRCGCLSPIRRLLPAATVPTIRARCRWNSFRRSDDTLNARLSSKYSFDKSAMDKPLPSANTLLKPNEALIDYFITRKWRADRESADPLEDERLYAIVTRKDQQPCLYDLGDPRRLIPAARETRMANLRSTRSAQERGAVTAGRSERHVHRALRRSDRTSGAVAWRRRHAFRGAGRQAVFGAVPLAAGRQGRDAR